LGFCKAFHFSKDFSVAEISKFRDEQKGVEHMSSRSKLLNLIAALGCQLSVAGLVSAQTPPEAAPPAGAPPPAEAAAETPPAELLPSEAGTASRRSATEEIVVTGSRIRRKDLTTPAPITVINREQITASGKVSIGDFLQTLPSQGNAINTAINNGGDGTTRVDLRGLGSQYTLVLVNGRRYVGTTGAVSSVDLNSIPTAAIERVEVLKDGASAVYGSDAIGGVINLITRKRFNGGDLSGYYGSTSYGDGQIYDFNGTAGVAGDRGSALMTLGYYTQHPVFAGDRHWSKNQRFFDATGQSPINPNPYAGEYTGGSTTIPAGRVVIPSSQKGVPNGNALWNRLVTQYKTAGSFIQDPNAPFGLGWRPFTGADQYNFAPVNYLVTPQVRISMYSTGDLKIANVARVYYEASFVNRQSDQQLAPEPLLTDLENVTVSANNIYNPFGRDFAAVRRRLLEFGPRKQRQDITTFRTVVGVDGTLPDIAGPLKGWFWDASFNYGRTSGVTQLQGNLFLPNLQAAVGPSFRDATGTPRCGTPGNVIAGCVPLDLFHGGDPPTITPDQIANLTFTGTGRQINQMVEAQANISGELFKLLADRPVGIAFGYAYRILSGASIRDPVTVLGLTSGNKGTDTAGHYYLNEGYGELSIPIVSGMPFAESVEATAALRVFDYSNFGSDVTYKFGGLWRIIPDFTIRGTYSTGFRAPSINQLFLGQSDAFPNVTDPCRVPAGRAPANCVAQGVAGNGDTATQLRAKVGGNADLKAETAKIYTGGVVIEPSMVKGLSVTADYYNIEINQTITTLGAGTILSSCYPADPNVTPNFCNLITRDPLTNFVTNITNTNINAGQLSTDGIDLSVRYAIPTEFGRFGAVWDATWLHKFNQVLPTGQLVKARGTYDITNFGTGGGVRPAWKFIAGANYGIGGFTVGLIAHFVGSFHECGTGGNYIGGSLCYQDPTDKRRVGSFHSEDITVQYSLFTQFGKTTIGAGVNNVLDHPPPLIYNGFTNNTDPTAYPDGVLGRFIYGRVSHSF